MPGLTLQIAQLLYVDLDSLRHLPRDAEVRYKRYPLFAVRRPADKMWSSRSVLPRETTTGTVSPIQTGFTLSPCSEGPLPPW